MQKRLSIHAFRAEAKAMQKNNNNNEGKKNNMSCQQTVNNMIVIIIVRLLYAALCVLQWWRRTIAQLCSFVFLYTPKHRIHQRICSLLTQTPLQHVDIIYVYCPRMHV